MDWGQGCSPEFSPQHRALPEELCGLGVPLGVQNTLSMRKAPCSVHTISPRKSIWTLGAFNLREISTKSASFSTNCLENFFNMFSPEFLVWFSTNRFYWWNMPLKFFLFYFLLGWLIASELSGGFFLFLRSLDALDAVLILLFLVLLLVLKSRSRYLLDILKDG